MIRNKARVSEWQMDVEKNSHQDSRRRMRRMLFGFLDQHDQPTFCRHTQTQTDRVRIFTFSLIFPFILSLICSFAHALTHALPHALPHSLARSLVLLFISLYVISLHSILFLVPSFCHIATNNSNSTFTCYCMPFYESMPFYSYMLAIAMWVTV